MPGSRRWLFIAVFATLALAATAMVADPATAAVPGPPTNLTARAGDQLVEVSWTAPTPDDPTITGYVVTASSPDIPPVTVDSTARTAAVAGLTNGTAYIFIVAATNPDGTGAPSDPSAPVTPRPPAATILTLAASPTSILYGGTVQLSGRLRQASTDAGIAGEPLALERRPKGGTRWTALNTVMTTSDGTLDPTQAVTPQANMEYRLRHAATPFYAARTSPAVPVLVGVRLTARSNRTSMALGRTATISGQVTPAHRGQRIRLQHKQGRTWRTVQTKALPASGPYFNLRPRVTGTSFWRIYKASDTDHIGAKSAAFRLVVYRAAITGIHADAAGDDRRNRNGEYALVRNTGAAAINLAGWKLDAGDRSQRFTLLRYALKKGATVRIHTGRGTTKAGHLYLGSGRPIWNNDGDTATLIDPHNIAVSRYRY